MNKLQTLTGSFSAVSTPILQVDTRWNKDLLRKRDGEKRGHGRQFCQRLVGKLYGERGPPLEVYLGMAGGGGGGGSSRGRMSAATSRSRDVTRWNIAERKRERERDVVYAKLAHLGRLAVCMDSPTF